MSWGVAEDRSLLHCIWRWGLGKGVLTSKNQVSAVISKNPFLGSDHLRVNLWWYWIDAGQVQWWVPQEWLSANPSPLQEKHHWPCPGSTLFRPSDRSRIFEVCQIVFILQMRKWGFRKVSHRANKEQSWGPKPRQKLFLQGWKFENKLFTSNCKTELNSFDWELI